MIIQIDSDLKEQYKLAILRKVKEESYTATEVNTQLGSYIVCISKNKTDVRKIGLLPGVIDVHVVSDSYKLVSGKWKLKQSCIAIDDLLIGNQDFTVMAGPCAIENETQVEAIARHLAMHGVRIMRGGIFKPRSSPYSFQGWG
jgi:3-deoxy-7-phosphoheptulonate synthase